jgi:hypothetical protein
METKVTGSGPMASNRKRSQGHHGLQHPQKKKTINTNSPRKMSNLDFVSFERDQI